MKKLSTLLAVLLIAIFAVFALGSGESESETVDQGSGNAEVSATNDTEIGDYSVEIKSCRLAKDYEGKNVIIVKYGFTNNTNDTPTSFMVAFDDTAFQNGVGLNETYFLADSAKYSSDNQTKEIKKGASIDVEVAYELNDTTTDVEIEVEELFSFDEKVIKKTFKINK